MGPRKSQKFANKTHFFFCCSLRFLLKGVLWTGKILTALRAAPSMFSFVQTLVYAMHNNPAGAAVIAA